MLRQYELVDLVKSYDPDADEDALNRAYVFAMKKHGAQLRASGDPYYSHPVEVAGILTKFKLDCASVIASRVWELGGNISLVFEKMYLDDLINLGMLEMSMLLIKPHFENLEEDIEVFPLEMIKFALITGSIPLLKKIIAVAPAEPLYQALNQFADSYRLNNYEEHFKNIQRIVVETFGREICAYDYNIYTDRGFTDLEVLLYFSNYNMELKKYQTLLETKIDGYFLTSGVKRIYNLSFACRNIKDHPKF